MKKSLLVVLLVLLCDQAFKVWVKLNMTIGESFKVIGNWFQICFIENNGMAFGWELSTAVWGKLILVLVRLAAVSLLIVFLYRLSKKDTPFGPMLGISLIVGGALGNIVDCLFYGIIFSESTFTRLATLFPNGGGYSCFLQGKVVDMLYFPLFTFPDWVPFFGNQIFFSPIFNIADSAITIGAFYLIIFHWKFIKKTLS